MNENTDTEIDETDPMKAPELLRKIAAVHAQLPDWSKLITRIP